MKIDEIDNIRVQKIQGRHFSETSEAPQAAATQPQRAGMCSCMCIYIYIYIYIPERSEHSEQYSVPNVPNSGTWYQVQGTRYTVPTRYTVHGT